MTATSKRQLLHWTMFASGKVLAAAAYGYYAFVSAFPVAFHGPQIALETPTPDQAAGMAASLTCNARVEDFVDDLDEWVEVNGVDNMFKQRVVDATNLASGGVGDEEDFIPRDAYAGRWAPA